MNLFEIILLDVVLVTTPLLIYLLYKVYVKTLDIKKSNIYLDCALFSSYYLLIRFGILKFNNMPILIFDIPLILAYLKNKPLSYTLISVSLIFYYKSEFDMFTILFIVEYIMYFILYLISKKTKIKDTIFVNIFVILKGIMFYIYLLLNNGYNFNVLEFVLFVIIFYIALNLIISLYNKIDEMLNLYSQIKQIEKEESIKNSLFKITHEIKNPVAVCKGYLDMFDVENIEHSRKYIPIMKSEINRILYLLEDFLSITKIKLDKDEMDLNMLLEDTVDCLKPILDDKNINFFSNITEDEIYINADYNRLKQALVNIIKNSKESILKDGTIKLYTEQDKKKIKVIIEDDGVGMSLDELNKIKEAFFTTKQNGTGLGIYMANEIITLHGGKLEYFSKKGVGTKVVITLPI